MTGSALATMIALVVFAIIVAGVVNAARHPQRCRQCGHPTHRGRCGKATTVGRVVTFCNCRHDDLMDQL